ncbi:MAG TPA: AarF/UbiB family protein [Terriglobales bacterium]|nr:AarF/UbiB family protein [Terriglobales bacterium]
MNGDTARPNSTVPERIRQIKKALRGRAGKVLREEMARQVVQLLPVDHLVPEVYARWRPLVRDAMMFMVSRLSAARLAPKLVEQMDLALDTPPEVRLVRLIANMPGLQKLGQVLSRNRHLDPALRDELSSLENSIRDADAKQIRAIIAAELAGRLETCKVEIEPRIFSEATVSAVVRFTWRNPAAGRRERGVFKVLKPHIPACFAEDMALLHELAEFLGSQHREYGFAARVLPDTFEEVRRLLERELDFAREQNTLEEAHQLYSSLPGVRVPRLIRPLCTSKVTAITEERGEKVTDAAARMPEWRRSALAGELIEALIAVPLLGPQEDAMFHADPHAGNLLYDESSGELVLLDWALTERLSREQRRRLAILLVMLGLRDPVGVCTQIQALAQDGNLRQADVIREGVIRFLDDLPLAAPPGVVEAMRLVERLAREGVAFPAPLIMFRKVLFTLDGILHEIAGPSVSIDYVLGRHLIESWMGNPVNFGSPLSAADWISVQWSVALYGSRVWAQWARTMLRPEPAGAEHGSKPLERAARSQTYSNRRASMGSSCAAFRAG